MSLQARIVTGALAGFVVGIVVAALTNLPFAPEAGLILGAFAGWISHRRNR